jgi:hypothetical protein
VPALAVPSSDTLHDELRILLGFWLEMPLAEYLDDLEMAGPAVAAAIRESASSGSGERSPGAARPFNLRMLIDEMQPAASAIPCQQLTALLDRIKSFAKRVHRPRKHRTADRGEAAPVAGRLEDSMPFEIAQVLYNLSGALALTRCEARIIGLSDDQFHKNITWVLNQTWLDARLRPVFFTALSRLRPARPG